MEGIFDKIQFTEAQQIMKTDFSKGIRYGVGICHMKEGFSPEDLEKSGRVEILDVIKAELNRYVCFVKVKLPEEYQIILKGFDLDLIWDTPTVISQDRIVVSAIGEKDALKRLIEAMRILGEIVRRDQEHKISANKLHQLQCPFMSHR